MRPVREPATRERIWRSAKRLAGSQDPSGVHGRIPTAHVERSPWHLVRDDEDISSRARSPDCFEDRCDAYRRSALVARLGGSGERRADNADEDEDERTPSERRPITTDRLDLVDAANAYLCGACVEPLIGGSARSRLRTSSGVDRDAQAHLLPEVRDLDPSGHSESNVPASVWSQTRCAHDYEVAGRVPWEIGKAHEVSRRLRHGRMPPDAFPPSRGPDRARRLLAT